MLVSHVIGNHKTVNLVLAFSNALVEYGNQLFLGEFRYQQMPRHGESERRQAFELRALFASSALTFKDFERHEVHAAHCLGRLIRVDKSTRCVTCRDVRTTNILVHLLLKVSLLDYGFQSNNETALVRNPFRNFDVRQVIASVSTVRAVSAREHLTGLTALVNDLNGLTVELISQNFRRGTIKRFLQLTRTSSVLIQRRHRHDKLRICKRAVADLAYQ